MTVKSAIVVNIVLALAWSNDNHNSIITMSQTKSILIIFNKAIALSDVEKDLIKIRKSKFFGLLNEKETLYNSLLGRDVDYRICFVKLSNKKYKLDVRYFPDDSDHIQCVEFSTDEYTFKDDLMAEKNNLFDFESKNIKKLIRIIKYNLYYYSMTLFFFDYDPLCPNLNEILEMRRIGVLEKERDQDCFYILDSPKYQLV